MNGFELLQRVISSKPELPLVLMSGSPELVDRDSALLRGAFDFIGKPLGISNVQQLVARALATRLEAVPI